MELERLEQIIRENFREPFLKAGRVEAKMDYETGMLHLRIGPREVYISRDGMIMSAGTHVGWEEREGG